jgi:hypothetical protein
VKGYFGIFGLDNQLGGANKVVGVADTANELNKLDGADKANVIVKVNKIVAVDEAIWFCCMFSLRMQDRFRIDNQPEVIIERDSLSKRPLCSFAARWEALRILFVLRMDTSIN